MSRAVALKGHHHTCPDKEGNVPHVGGPIVQCQQDFVKLNGIPIALVGDQLLCEGAGVIDTIATGSSCVRINGIPVARIGDATAHGGTIDKGDSSLKID